MSIFGFIRDREVWQKIDFRVEGFKIVVIFNYWYLREGRK